MLLAWLALTGRRGGTVLAAMSTIGTMRVRRVGDQLDRRQIPCRIEGDVLVQLGWRQERSGAARLAFGFGLLTASLPTMVEAPGG